MNILGLSGALGHDPAACVVRDGQLVAMVEEERLAQVKHGYDLAPVRSVLCCLHQAGLGLGDIDVVATSWDPALDPQAPSLRVAVDRLWRHEAFRDHPVPPVVHVDHHLAHAAASFFASGFGEAAILVADGQGERVATTLAHGQGRSIEVLRTFPITDSLGYFYGAVAHYVGLGHDAAGKTMGLAAHGAPVHAFPTIAMTGDGYHIALPAPEGVPWSRWNGPIRREWLRWMEDRFGPRNTPLFDFDPVMGVAKREMPLDRRFQDVAASAQRTLEEVLVHLVRLVARDTGSRRLALSGGVALNCSANGVIARSGLVDAISIFPAAHDAGGAVGAAFLAAAWNGEPAPAPVGHAYWGPGFDEAAVEAVLARLHIPASRHPDIGRVVAERLTRGRVVGWMQGRMEVGPRALGHRSILARPGVAGMHARVNAIKGRESWRPLAPAMLETTARRLFGAAPAGHLTPFMLEARTVPEEFRAQMPAVVHIDGTTRPQIVGGDCSPRFRALLESMEAATGWGMVLNTSFNLAGEPIVCSPVNALRTFFSSGLDDLAIGEFLVTKAP